MAKFKHTQVYWDGFSRRTCGYRLMARPLLSKQANGGSSPPIRSNPFDAPRRSRLGSGPESKRPVCHWAGRRSKAMKITEPRQAKLPDGEQVTWHMFYVDRHGIPMALVETCGGVVRTVPATWIEFVQVSPKGFRSVNQIFRHYISNLTPKNER